MGGERELWEERGSCGRREGVVGGERELWEEGGSCGRREGVVVHRTLTYTHMYVSIRTCAVCSSVT